MNITNSNQILKIIPLFGAFKLGLESELDFALVVQYKREN